MKKLLNAIYVITPDSYLYCENEGITVKVGGQKKLHYPAIGIDTISCFGNATVSTPLIAFCGAHGIGLSFFSPNGRFYGRVSGPMHGNVLLRQQQFAAVGDPFTAVRLARGFVLGKLVNSRAVLSRAAREHPEHRDALLPALERLREAAKAAQDCLSLDGLRGIEGQAAAAYFSVFDLLLHAPGEGLRFDGRNRRPPEDPVNALLSFLYTLLKSEIQSALEGVGLDPAAGFLHTLRPGRPALALDLMEELRAPLCDRLALALINRGQITPASFESLTPPVLLTDSARRTVLTAWRERRLENIQHPFFKEKMPIGLLPHAQALLLARVLRGELDEYPPFHWR